MNMLPIAATWMALMGGGFVALSALGRRELRNDLEADRATHAPEPIAVTDSWPSARGISQP